LVFVFTCKDRLRCNVFAPSTGPLNLPAELLYSLTDFLLDAVTSTLFAEDWCLDGVNDVPAGEVAFVASEA
jgi:hypothetical protein